MNFVGYDGERIKYFKEPLANDCATRAIAIALEVDYKVIWDEITKRLPKNKNADMSVPNVLSKKYLLELGWKYIKIRKEGNKHYKINELPKNKKIIVHIAKHMTVLDYGNIVDTYNCSPDGKAIVYGYFEKEDK